ncbi:MAG TPA: hypothetical protein ENK80_03580, partial [Rhodobacterales bacterium]|nr:hypothetical protein [Rhodobacterales bacterium]
MPRFTTVLIGGESLAIACAEQLLERGHTLAAFVSPDPEIRAWAEAHGIAALETTGQLPDRVGQGGFDWLLSIANLAVIPDD